MIFGAVIEPDMGDEVRVTVIATGFERTGVPRRALEHPGSRATRSNTHPTSMTAPTSFPRVGETVSVGAELNPKKELQPAMAQTQYGTEDLDIPTFLRNRR
jgi:cell division protein FtsZ